ncbi:MAG: GNAT family N-acetyltransferase [Candidatus Lindowbacteria bacterium]|nr:GNAT family N-acetyltransferase [Candidatus Lindowbacteria bacterium]
MKFRIREMSIEDYNEVMSLWKETEGIGLSDADTREGVALYLKRNPSLSFVAHVDDVLVGAVLCGHDGRRGYLHHLAVSKKQREKGVGRALVEACIAQLAKLGIQKCNIFLYADNHNAKAFWSRMGWFPREDLNLMQKMTQE